MSRFKYAYQYYNAITDARASIRQVDMSHKHAREIGVAISGLWVDDARSYLLDVVNKRRAIPFGRYKNQVGHRSDSGVMAGRYPQKAAHAILKLLDSLENNAEFRGLDVDRLQIVNVTVHKGTIMKRFTPRAMGRATPKNDAHIHVEVVAREVSV